jgi:predicted amidohydrolase YtcJ
MPASMRLGIVASMQPVFVGEYSRWAADRVGPDRIGRVYPVRDLLVKGALIAAGTDYPASDSGDPIATLSALVTRRGADGTPRDGWLREQRIASTPRSTP